MKTPQEIQDWLQGGWKQSQYAKTDDRGRLGIDTDGVYGFQCKDFVNGYLNFMVGWMPSGNAIDLWSMDLPASIERIANTPEFIPQLGDVAVFGEPYGYDQDTTQYLGHTCVILKADMNQFDSIDQNWLDPSLTIGSPPAEITHNYRGFLGILRVKEDKSVEDQLRKDIQTVTTTAETRGNFLKDISAALGLDMPIIEQAQAAQMVAAIQNDKSAIDTLRTIAERRGIYLQRISSALKRQDTVIDEPQVMEMVANIDTLVGTQLDHSADVAKLEEAKKAVDTVEGDLK